MKTDILQDQWHTLEVRWRETRDGWNDPVAWRFEREFWEPLNRSASRLLRQTEALSERLEAVRARIKR